MSRHRTRKKSSQNSPRILQPGPLDYRPFQVLKEFKAKDQDLPAGADLAVEAASAGPERAKTTVDQDPAAMFQAAMADVVPPAWKNNRAVLVAPCCPKGNRRFYSEDLEVLLQLEDLIEGRRQIDLVDSDEYLEGYVRGIHPVILEKLRRGLFSVQAHLDLHGLTADEAELEVREFITRSAALGHRCVLLVHGRGLNSKDQIPVLKKRLTAMLLRGPVRKKILAFTSAQPHDGGTGASYVLLKAREIGSKQV